MFRHDLTIALKLAAADPRNTQWPCDLSISRFRVGDALAATNRPDETLASFREGSAIREALATKAPDNPRWLQMSSPRPRLSAGLHPHCHRPSRG